MAEQSLPLRGVWIEIGKVGVKHEFIIVAPLAGSVD